MPAWNQVVNEFDAVPPNEKADWLQSKLVESLRQVGHLRGGRHVLLYASAFLQKPQAPPPTTQVTHEDLNGFMSSVYGMNCGRGVTILIHSPGGVTNAAETIVAYLRSKFTDVEVVVPAIAMSAATMIALASDRIVMGRQSQIGPIDPHFITRASGGFSSIGSRSVRSGEKRHQERSEQRAPVGTHPRFNRPGATTGGLPCARIRRAHGGAVAGEVHVQGPAQTQGSRMGEGCSEAF